MLRYFIDIPFYQKHPIINSYSSTPQRFVHSLVQLAGWMFSPDLNDPVLRAKLAKGMGHNATFLILEK